MPPASWPRRSFHPSEDTRGYLALLEGLVRQWGIPLALYSDRHAAFKYNARQGPLLYESTQFARVMRELGIRQIFALSPRPRSLSHKETKGLAGSWLCGQFTRLSKCGR